MENYAYLEAMSFRIFCAKKIRKSVQDALTCRRKPTGHWGTW